MLRGSWSGTPVSVPRSRWICKGQADGQLLLRVSSESVRLPSMARARFSYCPKTPK
ncbi:hypothetical protein ACRALDRAFT_1064080 [Sodiomyces alcalophilus JCM 7366]|uniref:uncharacterized protein n=1 Tax=Sodiomyces alcalophilus JCM 7366 TaxID=591952 RepID=UPI0039B5E8FB